MNLFAALISLIPTPEAADEGAAALFLPPIYPFIYLLICAGLFAPAYVCKCLFFFSLSLSPEHQNHAREVVKKADLSQWDALVIMSGDGLLFEVLSRVPSAVLFFNERSARPGPNQYAFNFNGFTSRRMKKHELFSFNKKQLNVA